MNNTNKIVPNFASGFTLFKIAVIVFASEAVIMFALHFLPPLTPQIQGLLDAILLTVLVSPFVYFLLIRKLKESEERHRTVMEYAADGIITIDEKGIVESFNPAAEQIFGYNAEEVVGRNVSMLMPEPYKGEHDGYLQKYLKKKKKTILCTPSEIVGQRKDGLVFPISLLISEMHLGRRRMFIGIIRDITGRKEAEMELKKLSAAVEQSPVTVIITDTDGKIEYVNSAFSHVSGYSREEAFGHSPRLLKSGKTPPEVYKKLWDTILSGEVWHGELMNKKKNGELFWDKTTISPIRDSEDKITHFLATKENVTERKKVEEAFRAKAVAEETSRLKSEFLASMSHELRNPLNSVIGFADRIPKKVDMGQLDKAKEQARDIKDAGMYLLALINDILDYAKIEAGKMELFPEEFSIREIIDNIKSQLDFQIQEKGLTLVVEVPEDLPLIFADRVKLTQVIMNLFSNAVKFTPPGGTIKLIAGANSELVLTLEDSGIGITAEDQMAIFDHFRQVGRSRQEQKGTGLGLAITKKLVEMHGGRIQVESKVDQGTTFRVFLPIRKKGENHEK